MDGSVLFASLLRAINIDPILVRTPGHMFVGYYTDSSHQDMNFLETTMIGDVDLDDFFPDEQLDSTMVGKSQNQMSLLTFEKSKQDLPPCGVTIRQGVFQNGPSSGI